jgi:hypothetical protein
LLSPRYLDGKEKCYVETFLPIIDTLNTHLNQRSESYIEINERFSFLTQLQKIEPDHLKKKCKESADFYCEDINTNELNSKCFHLREYLKTFKNESVDFSILAIHALI